jgi:aminomethyltransferase
LKHTSLFDYHTKNAKMVEFAGYEMPIWYTNITEEHLAVRNGSGIFDVSHMGRIIVRGPDAGKFVDYLVPTQASNQPLGKSFYTLLLNERAGIIDDLIVIKRNEDDYLLVINAGTTSKDLSDIRKVSHGFDITVENITEYTTMIAIQGPDATRILQSHTPVHLAGLKRFRNTESKVGNCRAAITRTGYTGEDGYEIILYDSGVTNNYDAIRIWTDLARNSKPCGLGARDSLRLEAGLPLYGSDIDESTNPIEADLLWVVSKDKKNFIGSERLSELEAEQPPRIRRGLLLHERIPRSDFEVTNTDGDNIGRVTSGTFSPILKKGIALAYIKFNESQINNRVKVNVRGAYTDADIVKLPFYDEHKYGWKRDNSK